MSVRDAGDRPRRYDRRPEWRRAVLRSSLSPLTKLVLLVTHEHMRPNGRVSVKRSVIANELGIRHTQRISERWADAVEKKFLTLVHKGSHGRPSTYEGLIPDPPSIRASRSLEEYGFPDARTCDKRPGFPDAITKCAAPEQPGTHAATPRSSLRASHHVRPSSARESSGAREDKDPPSQFQSQSGSPLSTAADALRALHAYDPFAMPDEETGT